MSEKAFDEYRAKVVEKIGTKKEQEVRDEVAQDRVLRSSDHGVIILSGTDVMCYDLFSDRYFSGSMEMLKQAQNNLNHRMLSDGYASLADFYELIGLPITRYSEQIGWTNEELIELSFSTVLSEDQRPCLAVDFRAKPNRRYDRFL
jgi:lipid II:glycine glycyltransferase (peptidoglycan interpeptide bridge formation enzyme)